MELKPQNFYIGCKRYRVLLIVPYGIETNLLISVLVSLQHF